MERLEGNGGLTSTNLAISAGKQRPVGSPDGPTVASQLYSRRKSLPERVEEMRPRMKKHVLSSGCRSGWVSGDRGKCRRW